MREKVIRRLIQIVEESNIESLEYRNWGTSIRITKRLANGTNGSGAAANLTAYPIPQGSSVPAAAPAPPAEDKLVPIKSPMVGTFYRTPAPDAAPTWKWATSLSPAR